MIRPGDELGPGPWLEVSQARIDTFGLATEDRESIHVSRELAAAGPYGVPVAHGFLTLALIAHFWSEVGDSNGYRTLVNYGLNRVRFPAPVPAGARLRGRFRVQAISAVEDGVDAILHATVEREGAARPACVAEVVFRLLR